MGNKGKKGSKWVSMLAGYRLDKKTALTGIKRFRRARPRSTFKLVKVKGFGRCKK